MIWGEESTHGAMDIEKLISSNRLSVFDPLMNVLMCLPATSARLLGQQQ